jgi:hypothetical protein
MDNIAGPPVDGDNFFGRRAEIERFIELLQAHDVLLLGPRRIGKTSIARAVQRAMPERDWLSIEVNAASCQDELDFVRKLVRAIEDSASPTVATLYGGLRDWASRQLARVETVGVQGVEFKLTALSAEDWTKAANHALKHIAGTRQRWLIYVDELPIFLYALIKNDPAQGVARVRRFLDWFRNDVRAQPQVRDIRWLLTGSVGLDSLAQRHGMADTINSLSHQMLKPFSEPEAAAMLSKLAARYQLSLSDPQLQTLIRAVGWPQPYYLQRLFDRLRRERAERPASSIEQQIEAAIELLVQPGEDNDFHHWEQRLQIQLGDSDAAHASALLTQAAATSDGARAETLFTALQARMADASADQQRRKFAELRDILLRDGYWYPKDDATARRYAFHLEPLRRWWWRRNEL